jgi:PBP1b-binding outer membrane lipoprotein LpoB
MKGSSVFIVIMAVVVMMVALSGCTSTNDPPVAQVTSTPAVTFTTAPTPALTTMPTPVPTPVPDTAAIADKAFVDAAEACIAATPVISNVTTQLAFTTCVQNTPDPKGVCAVKYKYNVLKATKDDATTAGYSRENKRIPLVREAYSRNMSYNTMTDTVEACNLQPVGFPM